MKKLVLAILLLIAFSIQTFGQNTDYQSGKISYITSQNVYVKFNSTDDISEGDTLFIKKSDGYESVLVVSNKSSISVVCTPIKELDFKKDQLVYFPVINLKSKPNNNVNSPEEIIAEESVIIPEGKDQEVETLDKTKLETLETENRSEVSGKISVSSYSNLSSERALTQRMRYTLALNTDHISNSDFSTETYISFNHTNSNWDKIKNNVFNGLKIYNFALKYETKNNLNIYFGRKINSKLSSIGAIDGIQIEKGLNHFKIGAIAGSRPDLSDYSFNFNLLQAGIYAGHEWKNQSNGIMRNNIAIVEQQNNGNTDRRFLYFQHYQSLVRNLSIFGSIEMDLYKKIDGVAKSDFSLTNLYILARYRALRNLSFSASYSNRNNIIYYETYKSFIDQLIDRTSLQGFRFTINYRPVNKISIGARASYRSRKTDVRPTINLNGYLNFISIPGVRINASISATYLETAYLNGQIYSLRLNKDLIKRKLFGALNYRYVNYNYTFSDIKTIQNIPEIQLNWRIIKDLRATFALEAIFEENHQYQRVYINLTKRF